MKMTRRTGNATSDGEYSDTEVSPTEHSKLLSAVYQLDSKQRVKPPSRKEPSLQVSEFHLVQSGEGQGNAVHLLDLAKTLKTRSDLVQVSRKLKVIKRKARTLPKPLEKPVAERIQRSVGFKKVKKQVSRWEPIVQKNRIADHLSFPLQQGRVSLDTTREFFTRFKTQSPLEAEVAEILGQSKCAQEDREKAEKEFPLSLEELAERRKEMARLRSQQSYEAAKARRQGKIKSKKYHRVQRRERLRKQIKDFETLQKTDPEAALEQLQQLERVRAKERMTLRHRNTGQWARSRAVRAKYDTQSRQALAEQLAISRDLTKRIRAETDSSEEEIVENSDVPNPSVQVETKNYNPWIATDHEMIAFIGGYRQYWEKHNKEQAEVNEESSETVENDVAVQLELSSNETDLLLSHSSDPEEGDDEELSVAHKVHSSPNNGEECILTDSNYLEALKASNTTHPHSEGKFGKRNTCAKVYTKAKNVCRVIKESTRTEDDSQRAVLDRPTEGSPKTPVKMCDVDNTETMEATIVKGTSSWIVTPVKLTDVQSGSPEQNKESLVQNTKCGKKRRKNKTDHKLENTLNKEEEMATNKNCHLDDLFEDMEQKLKQKVCKKLSDLKNNIESCDIPDNSKYKVAVDIKRKETSQLLKTKARSPQEDIELVEETGQDNHLNTSRSLGIPIVPKACLNGKEVSVNRKDDVDPNKFLSVKPKLLQTQFPDIVSGGDEGLDNEENEENQQMTITEAFTGDDVVAEFAQEKADEEEKSKSQDVDLSLPGWGSWAGTSLSTSKRKKRRFIVKFPKVVGRKDENKGHLIINEDKDTKILQHQVSEVPFPFTTVKDFEASIRAPIGNTWVPETAHHKLIEPQVKTKLGSIIQPMDEVILVNKKKKIKGF